MIILHVMKITVTIMMTIKLLIMVVVVMMIKIELFLTARHGQLFTSFFFPCRSEGLSDKAKMPVFKPSFIVDRKTCY